MVTKLLGRRVGVFSSIAWALLLFGAMAIYVIVMSICFGEAIGIDDKKLNFRVFVAMFSVICASFLLCKDMKVLSYVSFMKVAVLTIVLFVSFGKLFPEYKERTQFPPLPLSKRFTSTPLSIPLFFLLFLIFATPQVHPFGALESQCTTVTVWCGLRETVAFFREFSAKNSGNQFADHFF